MELFAFTLSFFFFLNSLSSFLLPQKRILQLVLQEFRRHPFPLSEGAVVRFRLGIVLKH